MFEDKRRCNHKVMAYTLHSLDIAGGTLLGTRTEPQLARDLAKMPRTYRNFAAPAFWGQHFHAAELRFGQG